MVGNDDPLEGLGYVEKCGLIDVCLSADLGPELGGRDLSSSQSWVNITDRGHWWAGR